MINSSTPGGNYIWNGSQCATFPVLQGEAWSIVVGGTYAQTPTLTVTFVPLV